jgi:hypothetical protein
MNQVLSTQPAALSPECENALAALTTYAAGSSRAVLLPLDAAVAQSISDRKLRLELERRLLVALGEKLSLVAIEYLCSKLAVIGSERSVSRLGQLLADPQTSTAARDALEKIPSGAASRALRQMVSKLSGPAKAGALLSLGVRRDADSVELCAKAALEEAADTAAAAAYALGNLGSRKAAARLKRLLDEVPASLRLPVADAVLLCAERLLADGQKAEAKSLYQRLAGAALPRHISQAALRGLQHC